MKGLMRTLLILISLMILTGCANQPVARSSDTELERLVGQNVTLSGQFELGGVVDPYINCNGEQVYLVPQGSFTWGSEYERMQGKVVSISGVLHFRHYEHSEEQHPPDYFYFDLETAKVELK
jgi:hypothetical protein